MNKELMDMVKELHAFAEDTIVELMEITTLLNDVNCVEEIILTNSRVIIGDFIAKITFEIESFDHIFEKLEEIKNDPLK